MILLCLVCGAVGAYGPAAEFRPSGDEVWCMACGDVLRDLVPVASGDYDCPPEVDRFVYMGYPSGNVVLFERIPPPTNTYWRTTDLTGRPPPYLIPLRNVEPLRPW